MLVVLDVDGPFPSRNQQHEIMVYVLSEGSGSRSIRSSGKLRPAPSCLVVNSGYESFTDIVRHEQRHRARLAMNQRRRHALNEVAAAWPCTSAHRDEDSVELAPMRSCASRRRCVHSGLSRGF